MLDKPQKVHKNPRLVPTWEEFRALPNVMRYITYLMSIAILYMLINIIGYIMPFDPFQFHKYSYITNPVCEGDLIPVNYEAAVNPGLYDLTRLTGEVYWTNADTGNNTASIPVNVPLVATDGIKQFESPAERIAPEVPGDWILRADITAHGRMFGIVPVSEFTSISSKFSVTVLDDSSPYCVDKENK